MDCAVANAQGTGHRLGLVHGVRHHGAEVVWIIWTVGQQDLTLLQWDVVEAAVFKCRFLQRDP
ncbi:MAG TPA: hypothetical protein VJQ25_01720, partial [Nitrospira sp.]|nr:hypothetical protein [Nitrospira sp.]